MTFNEFVDDYGAVGESPMKCSHDACTREAEENGYCKVCIQLPSKECNFCKPKEKVGFFS